MTLTITQARRIRLCGRSTAERIPNRQEDLSKARRSEKMMRLELTLNMPIGIKRLV